MFIHDPFAHLTKLNAYLTASISAVNLANLKKSYETGASVRDEPLLELVIKDEPSYRGRSHAEVIRAEADAGRTDPFVLIDGQSPVDGAVWYVQGFARADQVDQGVAVSTDTVLKIRVRIECVAPAWANYQIANILIEEDLEGCGVEIPIPNDFEQERVCDYHSTPVEPPATTWITAEPGEFDVSTDKQLTGRYLPRAEKVVRLKEEVAKEHGLLAEWAFPHPAGGLPLEDGTGKTFPEGCVSFKCKYDPELPRPEYKWPEGSL